MKTSISTFLFALALLFMASLDISFAQAAADEKEVIVLGIGTTEDEAKQQAYRSAIQSVIGSMLLSETIVENESLVKDKILSHSDGYVVKALQVGKTTALENGLLEVTMRVTVKSERLKARLKAENITMTTLDGQSLFAQKTTQEDAKQDAVNILKDKIKNLPAAVLTVEANVQASTHRAMGDMVQLTIPIQLSVNQDAYKKLIADMKTTLSKLGFKGKTLSVSYGDNQAESISTFSCATLLYSHVGRINESQFSKYNLLSLGEIFTAQNVRITSYLVPQEIALALQNTNTFSVLVELMDASGAVVTSQEWINSSQTRKVWASFSKKDSYYMSPKAKSIVLSVKQNSHYYPATLAYILPSAFCNASQLKAYFYSEEAATYPMIFDLSDDELKSITNIKCTVNNVPTPKE